MLFKNHMWLFGCFLLPFLMFYSGIKKPVLVGWDLSPRTLTYQISQQDVDDSDNLTAPYFDTVQLIFQPVKGDVIVRWNGQDKPSTMNEVGRIVPKDIEDSYFYWEIFFMSIIPPDGEVEEGKSWTLRRPADDEIEDLASLTSQAHMRYEVTSVDPVIINYTGLNWISPSSELDAMADDFQVSKNVIHQLVTEFKPYAEGEVIFSRSEGATFSAEGIVAPWAAFGEGMNVKDNPGRIHFKITRI